MVIGLPAFVTPIERPLRRSVQGSVILFGFFFIYENVFQIASVY